MIEIYIFTNPLDYGAKPKLQQLFSLIKNSSRHIKFHLIPTISMPLMDQYFNKMAIPRHQLDKRNKLTKLAYHIALNYENLVTLNKKRAIEYLYQAQELVEQQVYDIELYNQLLAELSCTCCNNSIKHLIEYNTIAKDKLKNNQCLINTMGINNNLSLVIYNFNNFEDFAIKLDDIEDLTLINSLIESTSIQEALEKETISIQ